MLIDPSVAFTVPFALIAREKTGKLHLGQVTDVADAGIDHQPLCAAGAERRREQVAEHPVLVVGRAADDDDVARLDLLGRDVQHPVVARLRQHGDRGAAAARAGIDRPHVVLQQADAAHRFMDAGDAEGRQLLDRRLVGALDVALDDAQLCHGLLLICRAPSAPCRAAETRGVHCLHRSCSGRRR
jgi:hypothetical protein